MFLICEKTSTNICINQLIKQETKNQEFCSFSHHFDVSCCELSAVLLRRANLYIHSCAFISNNCKGSLWAGFKFGWQKSRNSVGAAEMKNWPSQCVLSASGRRHRCRSHRRPARRRDVTQTDTLTEILKRQIGLLTASESSSSSHKRSAARGFPTTFSSAISPYKHANTHTYWMHFISPWWLMILASSEISKEMENMREMTHAEQNIVSAAFATLSFLSNPLPGAVFWLFDTIQTVWSQGGLHDAWQVRLFSSLHSWKSIFYLLFWQKKTRDAAKIRSVDFYHELNPFLLHFKGHVTVTCGHLGRWRGASSSQRSKWWEGSRNRFTRMREVKSALPVARDPGTNLPLWGATEGDVKEGSDPAKRSDVHIQITPTHLLF